MKRFAISIVVATLSMSLVVPQASVAADAGDPAGPVPAINWHPCRHVDGFDCAKVPVPLDYDDPLGETIRLALTRLPASGSADQRIGSIFTNPGGPGGSGVGFIHAVGDRLFSDKVRARFDVIGFDPRGVADSAPLECFESYDDLFDLYDQVPYPFPATRQQEERWLRIDRLYRAACADVAGPIIDHMSTANVARDMDLMREAVGDEQMTYYGVSYGSFVGETYAAMFPDRVRSVAVDGIIDPISYTTGRGDEAETLPSDARLKSEQGAYDALLAFLRNCNDGGDRCAFSSGTPKLRYERMTRQLLHHSVVIGNPGHRRRVTYADVVSRTLYAMYSPRAWSSLATFLHEVDRGTPAKAGRAHVRVVRGDAYEQTDEGFYGVWCSEADNPSDPWAWASSARAADAENPYFGRAWIWSASVCARWPGRDDDRYAGPFDVSTANDVLIIGNRNDPATRYQDAVSTSQIFPDSRLLTVDGSGHTSLFLSRCADRYLNRYLLTGVVPAAGTHCQVDEVPFSRRSGRSEAREQAMPFVMPGRRPA